MILHIFNDQKKFSKGYFQMLVDNGISLKDMELIHYGKKDDFFDKVGIKARFIDNFFNPLSNFKLISAVRKADKVIVHSLASPYLLLLIAVFPSVAKKIYWIVWGKDLYFYQMLKNPRFYHKIYEKIRIKAIKRITNICSIFEEDYDLACKWYGTNAENIEMITLYPYALGVESSDHCGKKASDKKVVLLGNSGSKTNNHISAIDLINYCSSEIEKVICPLSYGGSKSYVESVIKYGKEKLGDKFVPLVDFMPKEKYFSLMDSVDIGIYNYDRQEGLGNIWSLMLSEKTIYMKHNTSTTSFFERNGIIIKDIEDCKRGSLETLPDGMLMDNKNILKPLISVDMSIKKWKEVLGQ